MSLLRTLAKHVLRDIDTFSQVVVERPLYAYQLAAARAIVDSVLLQRGLEFAVMFPRQSGKNETQAQIEAYLLNLFQRIPGAQIVKAQPTFRPQAINALLRLEWALGTDWNRGQWRKREGYLVQLGEALMAFFSAEPAANAVGATASVLLECDEAQDVLEAEWQKKFVPMAASTNATVVYWGTAWTSQTLLAKAIRHLRQLEQADGVQRVFVVSPEQVAADNPAYGEFVARQVARLGRTNPLVRTQFFNEEIDAEGGMFPPARRALMQGTHGPRSAPEPGRVYALLLDVAGEDEGATGELSALANPGRDSTVLTVVEVDLATLQDPILAAPTYRCVFRQSWRGARHAALYGQLRALAEHWQARYLVVDATGVGAGLASFLANALGDRVIPFEFNGPTKSTLGWDFLAVCDTGRYQDYAARPGDAEAATFWQQLEACQYAVAPGPAHALRWGVPDGARDPATSELIHDDAVLSAALCAALDAQPWSVTTGPGQILRARDPLEEMSQGF